MKINPSFSVPETPPPLLYADTHASTDMLYFGKVEVHDPFIAFGASGKKITVQNSLEFGRVKNTSDFDTVLPIEKWHDLARSRYGQQAGIAEIIATVTQKHHLKVFRVPAEFPAGLYVKLQALGLRLDIVEGSLFPEREIKTATEIAAIQKGNRLCSVGYTVAESVLRAAKVKGRTLIFQGLPLTSERLRFLIETAIKEQGGDAHDTIVAGGDQACDPHERGTGPLRPHELIVIDIFPRVMKVGYHGDMTRTYLKGRPREAQRRIVATVRKAQLLALGMTRVGVDGRNIHQAVCDFFVNEGYKTRREKYGSVGYFHGTGHGLGLAVHDVGRIGPTSYILKSGSVMTIEPGLYYPGLGGCRWEDAVQVGSGPAKLLSHHPYRWEIF